MKPRTLLQSLGVAAFVLFRLYSAAIAHPSDLRTHTPVALTNFVLSLIVNLALTALVFAFLAAWIARCEKLRWLRLLLPGAVAVLLAKVTAISLNARIRPAVEIALFLGITIVAIALQWKWRRGGELLSQWTDAALVGMGIFSLFVVLQLAGIAVWRPAPNSVDTLREHSAGYAASSNRPRVVWILFDELSYRQTFGSRYPGLKLPNFDRLRETSTLFTHTQPVKNYTELAIPSLLLGYPVTRVHYTFNNRFQVATATNGSFHTFNAALTPFAQAHQQGLTTAVVGWYNPYCAMLAPYLNYCYWTSEEETLHQFGIRDGFWKDFATPWIHYLRDVFHPGHNNWLTARHAETYQDLLQHSDQVLKRPDLDFVFIHLPIPHPPIIYNRTTQRFDETNNRSYIDNLALADAALGHMLAILQQSPRWKNTSVIVCGDHSWRTWMWSSKPEWTREDEAASHGAVFDPRPMLMVHLAGQTIPATVAAPYPLIRVHGMLEDLIVGKKPQFSR